MISIEKDDFTGLRKINSEFYGLTKFISFDGPSDIYIKYMLNNTGISDAFDLLYLESESGQGNMLIRVCSAVGEHSGNTEWPNWDDSWPMLVDGERVSLESSSTNTFEDNYELKVYDLPIDVFSKLINAKEIKFSLRGRNNKIEGTLMETHQVIFKAFEQYCFGDESEGKKLIESTKKKTVKKAVSDTSTKKNSSSNTRKKSKTSSDEELETSNEEESVFSYKTILGILVIAFVIFKACS